MLLIPIYTFRTVTILTCETVATFTGVCSPPTLLLPRRSCWQRNPSSLRRRTLLSRHC
ncbi:hypothetical protein DPMN_007523 [Dreissena polymorpha]|uniref:Uncharacterized protein n=1 Tax=Dreissena polymorpha TaxID=45954 RepID=A0A9D4MTS7_DREPO|nr:hypothetical protein DPMN_007523 [Dreissena polymorpha]